MRSRPRGFDLIFSAAAQRDRRGLDYEAVLSWEALSAVLLDDPTLDNPLVRDLSNGGDDPVYAITAFDLTVLYQFVNPLVIRIVHVAPVPLDPD